MLTKNGCKDLTFLFIIFSVVFTPASPHPNCSRSSNMHPTPALTGCSTTHALPHGPYGRPLHRNVMG